MKCNLEVTFNTCGRTLHGTAVELVNNTMNKSGDALVEVKGRRNGLTFRVPMNKLEGVKK